MGAGRSVVLEEQLARAGHRLSCDRTDVEPCEVDHPLVGACYRCSIEDMSPIAAGAYDVAFANYVLEHVPAPAAAARELARVLSPRGYFAATVPDPSAPEFVVSRLTPLPFHRWVRGGESWATCYGFRNIDELVRVFDGAGFETLERTHAPFVEQYLARFRGLRTLGAGYDRLVAWAGAKRLMGNVFVLFRKTG